MNDYEIIDQSKYAICQIVDALDWRVRSALYCVLWRQYINIKQYVEEKVLINKVEH